MKKFLCIFFALLTLMLTGCGGVKKEVYSGEGYKFSYDPDKWYFTFKKSDSMAYFVRKEFDDVGFSVYRYTPEENVSLNERLERSKEICKTNDYIWDSGEILSNGGREWGRVEYRMEIGGDMFKYVDFLTDGGTYAYAVSFTSDADSFDSCIKEFEEIFDSFVITE